MEVVWRDGQVRKRRLPALPPAQARVFLRDHHEGYIDWTTFEEHQRMIGRSHFRGDADSTAGAAGAGHGLLSGQLRCGRCGRKLHVRYWGKGTAARYLCAGTFARSSAVTITLALFKSQWTMPRSCACASASAI